MALEPGGRAAKLGNRYEGRWVVRQLLRVLNDDLLAVTCEAVGDDERGVDLWVEHPDGVRQYQQCKIRNASKDHWSIADLAHQGILAAMKLHLDRQPTNQFAIVTPLTSVLLHDICESARSSSGDPEEFFSFQIEAIGQDRRNGFRQFCQRLDLNSNTEEGRAQAFSYLRRFFIEPWPDTNASREDLIGQARMHVCMDSDGTPSTVVAVLAAFTQDNLGKRLDAAAIWRHLESNGFHPRRLPNDTRIMPRIRELQEQFAKSISDGLIAGTLIARTETQSILDAVEHNGVIVVHGAPGQGKSGVLLGLLEECKIRDIAYLPLRLDRQEPEKTARQYGNALDLRESPVKCLNAVAGDRPAVLILDQLDAIRWTLRHSLGALEVCKELVGEVKSLRATGKQFSVVLACRTYDMQNDPEIKNWLQSEEQKGGRSVEIAVEPLSTEAVAKVVETLGQNPGHMSARQRDILQCPQHLAMWAQLVQEQGAFEFQSRVQLMRQYWSSRLREMAKWNVREHDANCALAAVVEHMERSGRFCAPRTVVTDTIALDALCACGLITAQGGALTFSHQSYLDYQIATRVVREIHANSQSICAWLGSRDRQTLHRREPLRQALCLLADESADQFLTAIKTLLDSDGVRFHLKHLCLEVIGQLDQPSHTLLAYLKELVITDKWKEHILGTVCSGASPFVRFLLDDGTFLEWLERDEWRDHALWLLRNLAEVMPDRVVEMLGPYAKRDDEWKKRVFGCLSWDPEDDSASMFELRLELARQGVFQSYVNWEKLAARRSLRLLEVVLSSWEPEDLPQDYLGRYRDGGSRFQHWSDRDRDALLEAVREMPKEAWGMLVPHICRLAPRTDESTDALEFWLDGDRHGVRQGRECIPHGLVQLAIEAGRRLANADGFAFWEETASLRCYQSPVVQFLLVETYTALPGDIANEALRWLLENHARFSIGTGDYEPEWKPAAKLIESLSPHCDINLFRELEETIIHYHAPSEREGAEHCLSAWRNGYFPDYWGRAQYFLLPSLCASRRSEATVGLIGVLERKYAGYGEERFTTMHLSRSGFVASSLPSGALERISDNAWLGIVQNKKLSQTRDVDHRRWRDGHWEGSSVGMFSKDMQQMARRFPERFGRLALRFPDDAPPSYRAAVLEGLKQTEFKDEPDASKAAWRPASVPLIERVLTRFAATPGRNYASSVCWLLHDRAEERWSDATYVLLAEYACNHPDPDNGKLCIGNQNGSFDADAATVENLENNALNCVRGIAALAMGQQLWNHADLLERFRPVIVRLCKDPHPAVRIAAVRACLPILNVDKSFAIECFCEASSEDLRVAACREAVYFFSTGMHSHTERLAPLVIRMLEAPQARVAEAGAQEVAARWLFNDYFMAELDHCLQGGVPQRKGVAKIAARFVAEADHFDKCSRLIERLKDDPNEEVRQSLHSVVRSTDILQLPEGVALVRSFVQSQAFRDDPTGLIRGLDGHVGTLMPFSDVLLSMCDQFVGPLRDACRDSSLTISHDISVFVPILVRLHEQAEESGNTQIVNQCLDAWDAMFERRIAVVHELATAIG